ncbi:MAG: alpha/beta hydrolase [Flammeovirgaceae bacterium]|nr:alpha/beta hydrolase [Flammeovirgaceae bacterium]MDW8287570.1 hypothetical protein [Flammeovirgaceae bacterium]
MFTFSPLQLGKGNRHLIAFHGAGQSPDVFRSWKSLFEEWTIWAFPLVPTSPLPNQENYRPTTFLCQFRQWLTGQSFERFSLLGYSLGAKPIYFLASYFPQRIEHLYLLAPEGIFPNIWYHWATRSTWGRAFFSSIVRYPVFFNNFIRLGKELGLISAQTARTAKASFRSASCAQKLWREWMLWRNFDKPHFFESMVTCHQLPISLVLAKNDTIIPNTRLAEWAEKIPSCRVYWLESSHEKLLSTFKHYILQKAKVNI